MSEVLRNHYVRVDKIPDTRNVRIVGMLWMDAKLRVWIRMKDSGMPALKSIVKSLRPAETLAVVPVRSIAPLPVCVTTENNWTRIVADPDCSLGKDLRVESVTGKVKTLNPEWSVMFSHLPFADFGRYLGTFIFKHVDRFHESSFRILRMKRLERLNESVNPL
jgi:hypothetical protein